MPDTPVPLLPWASLGGSAQALTPEDREAQLALALDSYEYLEERVWRKWRPAAMWRGHEGALLYWVGELARQMPYDRPLARRWHRAWGRAFSRGQMAVGRLPWWLGKPAFHFACQSQLIAADPRTYAPQFPHAPLDVAYLMPIGENEWQTL